LFFKGQLARACLTADRPAFSAAYDFLISLISFDCFSKAQIALHDKALGAGGEFRNGAKARDGPSPIYGSMRASA
jgi:hypothetical protein